MQGRFRINDVGTVAGPAGNWRTLRGDPALADVHRSVAVPRSGWRRLFACVRPGCMVAVGCMDPGNWAASLARGSTFGHALLFVALMSSIMAIVLQALCARIAIASGRDLAQACRAGSAFRCGSRQSLPSSPPISPRSPAPSPALTCCSAFR